MKKSPDDIKNKLNLLIENLSSNSEIVVKKNKIRNGIDEYHLKVLDEVNLKFDDSLMELYQSFNGGRIQWELDLEVNTSIKKYSEDETSIGGEIHIAGLSDLLFPQIKITKQFKDQFLEDEVEDLQNFRVFDKSDDYMRVGFLIEDGIIKSDLYYVLEDADGFSELPFSLEEYLNLMISYKGVYYWQYGTAMDDDAFKEKTAHYFKQIFKK